MKEIFPRVFRGDVGLPNLDRTNSKGIFGCSLRFPGELVEILPVRCPSTPYALKIFTNQSFRLKKWGETMGFLKVHCDQGHTLKAYRHTLYLLTDVSF